MTPAQPERRQHRGERAALTAKHHADSQIHDADPQGDCWRGRRLPVTGEIGEEARAHAAILGEHSVASAAVVADARRADENGGRFGEPGQGLDEQSRGRPAALADAALILGRPPKPHDTVAGEVDDRVGSCRANRREGPRRRIPAERVLAGPPGAAHERDHAMSVRA